MPGIWAIVDLLHRPDGRWLSDRPLCRPADGRPGAGAGAGGAIAVRGVVRADGAAAGRPDRRDDQGQPGGIRQAQAAERMAAPGDGRQACPPARASGFGPAAAALCSCCCCATMRRASRTTSTTWTSKIRSLLGGIRPAAAGGAIGQVGRDADRVAAALLHLLQRLGEAGNDLADDHRRGAAAVGRCRTPCRRSGGLHIRQSRRRSA